MFPQTQTQELELQNTNNTRVALTKRTSALAWQSAALVKEEGRAARASTPKAVHVSTQTSLDPCNLQQHSIPRPPCKDSKWPRSHSLTCPLSSLALPRAWTRHPRALSRPQGILKPSLSTVISALGGCVSPIESCAPSDWPAPSVCTLSCAKCMGVCVSGFCVKRACKKVRSSSWYSWLGKLRALRRLWKTVRSPCATSSLVLNMSWADVYGFDWCCLMHVCACSSI